MGNYIDLTGQRFGKLVVLEKGETHKTAGGQYFTTWICKCDCGNLTTVQSTKLRKGHTTSCGCVKKAGKQMYQDLTGMKFNRLTVISYIPISERKSKTYSWLCKCDCGKLVDGNPSKLKNGLQKSCGCLKEEIKYNIGNVNKKYKFINKRLYSIYQAMVHRCYDKNGREYHNYGGRGITVCEEWLGEFGYDVFAEWALNNGYDLNAKHGVCTLDRINVDKGYSPENCTWITNQQQQCNKRTNVNLTYNGETHCMTEWARILNIPFGKIRYHHEKGESLEQIIGMNG